MIFVKQTNGNVKVTTDGGDTILLIQDTGVQISVIGASSDAIQIRQFGYPIYSCAAADVSATQILPAAAIAFTGTAAALIDLLASGFFLIDSNLIITGTVNVNVVSPNPLPVSGTLTANVGPITYNNDFLDAFYRLRTSQPETVFDSKQIGDNAALFFDDQQTSGGGTTSTYAINRASTTIAVANLTAGTRVRQTFRHFNYQPGKSQLVICTFIAGASATGITKRVGLFNANNGIFFEQTSAGPSVVIRSFVTGIVANNIILQANWNRDKLNGLGPSGITLNFAQSQIFFFDFEWLGVGRVRCGFFVNGVPYYCHEFNHSNIIGSVYMSTPNLPVRYEIVNSGAGPAASLEHICSTVISEAGQQAAGYGLGISRGLNAMVTLNNTAIYPVLTMRLRSGYLGSTVKPSDFNLLCTSTAAYNWYLLLNPAIVGVALTYNVLTNSSIEYDNTSTGTTTVTGGTLLKTGVGSQSNASDIGGTITAVNDFYLGSNIAGTADIVTLAVQRIAGTTETFYGSLNFLDQK